jgi:hypothetical protein
MCRVSCAGGQHQLLGHVPRPRPTPPTAACDRTCASGQICSGGMCQVSCGAGTTNCTGVCRDLDTDRLNCGACGMACPSGQVCSNGTCQVSCGAGTTNCMRRLPRHPDRPRQLRRLRHRVPHRAGVLRRRVHPRAARAPPTARASAATPRPTACTAAPAADLPRRAGLHRGACQLSCATGSTECSGVCRDLQTDIANCGACGMMCPAGQICARGACVVSCAVGQTNCTGVCRDLQTDLSNCGSCGTACPAGQVCSAGTCRVSCGAGTTTA